MISKFLSFIKRFWIIGIALAIAVFFFFITRQQTLSVVESIPKNTSTGVLTTSEINIVFNREVKDNEKSQIEIGITPNEPFELVWTKNSLKIVLKNPLKPATTYSLAVKNKGKSIYQFSFETGFFTKEQIAKEGLLQSQGDFAFGEAYKTFASQYPWYLSLPVERPEYRIVYDFEQSSFRIRFKIAVSDKNQEDALIKKALEDLKKIGVPEPIPYYIINE